LKLQRKSRVFLFTLLVTPRRLLKTMPSSPTKVAFDSTWRTLFSLSHRRQVLLLCLFSVLHFPAQLLLSLFRHENLRWEGKKHEWIPLKPATKVHTDFPNRSLRRTSLCTFFVTLLFDVQERESRVSSLPLPLTKAFQGSTLHSVALGFFFCCEWMVLFNTIVILPPLFSNSQDFGVRHRFSRRF
jgi:hypothetical protein